MTSIRLAGIEDLETVIIFAMDLEEIDSTGEIDRDLVFAEKLLSHLPLLSGEGGFVLLADDEHDQSCGMVAVRYAGDKAEAGDLYTLAGSSLKTSVRLMHAAAVRLKETGISKVYITSSLIGQRKRKRAIHAAMGFTPEYVVMSADLDTITAALSRRVGGR